MTVWLDTDVGPTVRNGICSHSSLKYSNLKIILYVKDISKDLFALFWLKFSVTVGILEMKDFLWEERPLFSLKEPQNFP